MKKSILLAVILFSCSIVFAQNELLVQSSEKGLYLNHKVSPRENFYSVGRLYNVSAKDIASFNGLDMNHGLSIGQVIKIPLMASNFTQSAAKGRAVYYVVGQKEGLYKVSTKNNNVLMASLRKWNKLTSDNISTGQKLIIGYLVSSEANNIAQHNEPEKPKPAVEEPRKETVQTVVAEKKPEINTEPRNIDPPQAKPAVNNTTQTAVSSTNGGYFHQQFDQQLKAQPAKVDETASAGIFKTSSGWQDEKYYALMDRVEPGTIIRIINPTNNKAVYVKVLGEMSGIRQNEGYNVRISNAAASALDVKDTEKFIVRVHY